MYVYVWYGRNATLHVEKMYRAEEECLYGLNKKNLYGNLIILTIYVNWLVLLNRHLVIANHTVEIGVVCNRIHQRKKI